MNLYCYIWGWFQDNYEGIIALLALFVSWRALRRNTKFNSQLLDITKDHNYLSVRPMLSLFVTKKINGGKDQLGIYLRNTGLGPAILQEYYIKVAKDEKIIDIQEIKRYVIDYFKREGVKDFICSSFSKNEVNGILPGKKHLIFEITNYNFGSRKMQEMIKNIGFQYRYTDMYGQKIEMKTFHVLNNKK
ncbi:MAG: hypothetical protein A2W90_19520 [Bacteroidetes bacterium GWF2_42_66]|nr:MAG: hypothetical protein A2W92_17960 [Bacteroidetes bacterium GWA2_42_15]OFX98647.1 MAG: hypothetical protein A2W89_10175 [Bacteroidetes bacterium GWE2_42_39]OFY43155.1 MAG: hypothetical protein A2W90_19520 [Bacteroidetes bacterium GWF2_42_66]HBL76994.1 hypothetical protein [Prolixibacteraceae bacterium]HCR88883.1 hypothetical protein [Prolixibacteraceae bacterium]